MGSSSDLFEPSRYETDPAPAAGDNVDELGFLRLRYKRPGESVSQLIEIPISTEQEEMTGDDRFVLSVAGWGQHITGGEPTSGIGRCRMLLISPRMVTARIRSAIGRKPCA